MCQLLLLFSSPLVSDSLGPHGLQHARPPCPSPSPKVCPSSCALHWWYHPAISSSDTLFSFCPQSFSASGTFPVICLFSSDDQNAGDSASASVLPVKIQCWSPLRLSGLISLLSKGLWGIFYSTTVPMHQFFGILPSLQSSSHNCTWLLGKNISIYWVNLMKNSNIYICYCANKHLKIKSINIWPILSSFVCHIKSF